MKEYKTEKRKKDKSDFATVDKVLDHTAISILNKLQRREKITDLSGAICSGKEANIYTALCSTSLISKLIQPAVADAEVMVHVVLKIYKTSAMLFKDRNRYIAHEKRFENFCTSNSRKLIKVWAEKEVRNLKRMSKHGILCPKPLYLKKSILIMTLIGDDTPAPRLKDAKVEDWNVVYLECLLILKDLYRKAGLIHADFSEYNLVYYNKKVYVIDVGQSIEKDQENSNNFLAMDIRNCNDFFERKAVTVKTEVEIFEDITVLRIPNYLKMDGKLSRETFIPARITDVVNKEDYELFMVVKPVLSEKIGMELSLLEEYSDEDSSTKECIEENEEIKSYSKNEAIINSLNTTTDDICQESTTKDGCVDGEIADPMAKINIYLRKLRLRNPTISKEDEKEYNKERKQIVKDMNKERRALRAIKNERVDAQKLKKSRKKQSKK